ncbi:MAG: hypothetical protein PHO70_01540 [Candidatus Omnitrophica bacterium]|nr:hypothetical protein [Candidatus Omnitrophota bacterium]
MNKKQLSAINTKKKYNWIRPKKKRFCADVRENPTAWILAAVALISLYLTYSNVELVNRPFVGIERVAWLEMQNTDWFESWFKIKNYGNKPALDYSVVNFRVIVMSLNKDLLKEKLKNDNKQLLEQYLNEYFLDLRNKVCRETTNLLADYFYKFPNATQSEVVSFLDSWSKKLSRDNILKYNGKLLVGKIEVNNDMFDYFLRNSQLIYPNEDNLMETLKTQMGSGGISGVRNGDNFIIIYWAIKYKGLTNKFLTPWIPKMYSTYYIGYNSESQTRELQEFRSWSNVK